MDAGRSPRRQISGRHRAALALTGLVSWLAGGTASFLSGNGAGAAALIVARVICVVLGLMGHRPSRISMSDNELSWESVDQAVRSQIEVATDNGENESVLAELSSLRERLTELQRTGIVPMHPAQVYDESIESAIRRLLPGATITRPGTRTRSAPDFVILYRDAVIYAKTKWRAD